MPNHKLHHRLGTTVDNRIFFVGLIISILGLLILVYDIPQMIFIQMLTPEELHMYDIEDVEKFQRIQGEFYVGVSLTVTGAALMLLARFPPAMFAKK